MHSKMKKSERAQGKNRKKDSKPQLPWKPKKGKRAIEDEEIASLERTYNKIDPKSVKTFKDFPLSSYTQKGLKEAKFTEPTEIQREAIGLALRGLDILGAAKTGSGKTLAFILPLLELLYRLKWSPEDGLGALVITPTRELAYQIFETLRKVGRFHEFSAGLVIGGKDIDFETDRMATCNIVICTPGRLLHHMDENPAFDAANLKMLILDEADRCLDMGFSKTMNAILENLPPGRQTLLFSATQTRSVRDLARLSLDKPFYVSVHEHAEHATPDQLSQFYTVCDLQEKVNMLWSFIKDHKKKKVLVFLQSCKQVKYMNELFKRLRCGASCLALYGSLHQFKRMAIYEEFCKCQSAVLFATDLAARGLDFPSVDWVVQVDCPEDATTYLHRVGRTARHASIGQSLLVLTHSEEEAMLKQLKAHKVPIEKIEVNPNKIQNIQRKIEAHLASDKELKASAQRAFQSYLKSIFLMRNKAVFDVFKLSHETFAASLGLVNPPRVRFLQKQLKMKEQQQKSKEPMTEEPKPSTSIINFNDSDDSDNDDDILTVKRKDHDLEVDEDEEPLEDFSRKGKTVSKVQAAKKFLKKNIQANKKVVFDEEGGVQADGQTMKVSEEGRLYELEETQQSGIDLDKAKKVLKAEDKFDKEMEKQRKKEKRREEKRKAKEERKRQKGEDKEEREDASEPEEGSEPDLNWLPDPDVVYGDEEEEEEEKEEDVEKDSSDEDSEAESTRKRKWKPPKKKKKAKQNAKKAKMEEADSDDGVGLVDHEELALQLLKQ